MARAATGGRVMVAYGFQRMFVPSIEARAKRQTIRAHRKRHARPGERVQLYQGLRTKSCRKIIPDPVCLGLDEVRFDLRRASPIPAELPGTVVLEVNGVPLIGAAADAYAIGDGFKGLPPTEWPPAAGLAPFAHMALWWAAVHGPVLFEGVAIRWDDRDG